MTPVRAAEEHERVVEQLQARWPVLPVRFGCLVTAEQVALDLRQRHDEYLRLLRRVTGRFEFSITAEWSLPEPTQAPDLTCDTPVPHLLFLGVSKTVEQASSDRAHAMQEAAPALLAPLAALADEHRLTVLALPRCGVNAVFLVPERNEPAFTATLTRVRSMWPEVTLTCTGPWPAFSFVGE